MRRIKMTNFLDEQGNVVNKVTRENVEAYLNWISSDENPKTDDLYAEADVPLARLIPEKNLSTQQKSAIAKVVQQSVSKNVTPERCDEFIELAKTQREIVGQVWRFMGNERAYGSRKSAYESVLDVIDTRPASENVAFGLAVLQAGEQLFHVGKEDDFSHISKENKKFAEELLSMLPRENSSFARQTAQEQLARIYVGRMLEKGSMLNFDTRNREVLNKMLVNYIDYNNFEKLDVKYVTKDIFAKVKNGYSKPFMQDTSKAQTQAEKNVNILPKKYDHYKKALMSLVQKQDKYDRNNYGEEKGLNQRFLELSKEFDLDFENTAIIRDVYFETAAQDIKAGHPEKLGDKVLGLLFRESSGYYIKMLPKEFLEKKSALIQKYAPKKVLSMLYIQNVSNFQGTNINSLEYMRIPLKEKERIIEEANAKNKENEPKKKLLESRAAEIEQSEKQLKALHEIARRKEAARTAMEQIQMAYANIRHYFKDNVPNPEEDMLSEDAVEKVMADRLRGKKSFVDQPEERSLPLLFGRAEEKKRRENLSEAINQFNKIMAEQLPKISDVYAGKILEQSSYLQMQVSAKTAQQSAEKAQKAYCDMQIGWEAENRELRQLQENEKAVSMARDRIKDKTEHNKLAAKEMVGIVEKSELQAVPETSEKKEKARLRSNNKKVVDALEQKENALKGLNDKQKIEKYSQMQRDALMKQEHNR